MPRTPSDNHMKFPTLLASIVLTAVTAVAQTFPTCAFTSFTRPCGTDLAGSQIRGPGLQWDVTNAAPGSVAILAIGQAMRQPLPLPGTNCLLVVDPRLLLVAPVDRGGNAEFVLRLPPIAPLSIDFQAVTVALNRNGRTAESSNAIEMRCR